MISELCLAVLQHELTVEQIQQHAQRYVGRAFKTWASGFGPRSLDEALHEGTDMTLGDLISDDTSVAHLDEFELGGPA